MLLFIIGIIEMVIIASWTKAVSDTKVLASGVITLMNVLVWYYVLQTILEDVTNWRMVVGYALGCAIGTMITTMWHRFRDTPSSKSSVTEENGVTADKALL